MNGTLPELCGNDGCRRLASHRGRHNARPTEAWAFLEEKDRKKLGKAGFATPRGGAKGAYQNHVARSSKVIIPYERLADVSLALYVDGYVIRLLPQQYFERAGTPRAEFLVAGAPVRVGENAFVLYRTHDVLEALPPIAGWQVRSLVRDGRPVTERKANVEDVGHYVLRIPRQGSSGPNALRGRLRGCSRPSTRTTTRTS